MKNKVLTGILAVLFLISFASFTFAQEKDFSRNVKPQAEAMQPLDKEVILSVEAKAEKMLEAENLIKQEYPFLELSDQDQKELAEFEKAQEPKEPLSGPTDSMIWYVATTGSDANPGTQALPFATIYHAVNIAAAGDTIQVFPGTYYHSFCVTKALNIIGSPSDPSKTIIDGSQGSGGSGWLPFIQVNSNDPMSPVKLKGFTVKNWSVGQGDAVIELENSAILENFIVRDNNKAGINVVDYTLSPSYVSTIIIRNSVITNNKIGIFIAGDGYGFPYQPQQVLLENVVVAGNYAPSYTYAAGVAILCRNVDIVNCTIFGNSGNNTTGGIFFGGRGEVNIINSVVWGNTGTYGYQVCTQSFSNIEAGYLNIQYSNIENGINGIFLYPDTVANYEATNIETDPSISTIISLGDYPIMANSPCLASGASQVTIPAATVEGIFYPAKAIVAPSMDISGNARPGLNAQSQIDANPDMGAYEIGQIGNVNHAGGVNATDALLVAQHFIDPAAFPFNPSQRIEADANDDGAINATDSLLILRYFANLIPALPYTGP